MAHGLGSHGTPYLSATFFSEFYEHPPLVFIIQSVFFRLFGSGIYVERFYSILTFGLNCYLILRLWKHLSKSTPDLTTFTCLPLVLFMLNENVFQGYTNNLLECTMSIFTLSAVYSLFLYLEANQRKSFLYIIYASLFIAAAFMCKGPTGLFPLAFFFLYCLFITGFTLKNMLKDSVKLFSCFFLILFLLLLIPSIRHNLVSYFDIQVKAALTNQRTENIRMFRVHILNEFFQKNLLPISITLFLGVYVFFKKKNMLTKSQKQISFLLLAIGASGTLPIMISFKQASYYLIPAIPFYAIGLAYLLAPSLNKLSNDINIQIPRYRLIIILLTSITLFSSIFQIRKSVLKEDKLLADVHSVGSKIEVGRTINIKAPGKEHQLLGYLQRYYFISLDTNLQNNRSYLIVHKSIDSSKYKQYIKVNLSLYHYQLYKRLE